MYDLETRRMAQQVERDLALVRAHRLAALGLSPAGPGLPGRLWAALSARLRRPAPAPAEEAFRPLPLVRDLETGG